MFLNETYTQFHILSIPFRYVTIWTLFLGGKEGFGNKMGFRKFEWFFLDRLSVFDEEYGNFLGMGGGWVLYIGYVYHAFYIFN